MKDELGRKVMAKFVGLRAKIYSYVLDDGKEDKKAKRTQKICQKTEIKFENDKNVLEATQLDNEIKCLEKSKINTGSL